MPHNPDAYLRVRSMVVVRNISSWSNERVQYTSRWLMEPWLRHCRFFASPANIQHQHFMHPVPTLIPVSSYS